jgi:hypothetical protein
MCELEKLVEGSLEVFCKGYFMDWAILLKMLFKFWDCCGF